MPQQDISKIFFQKLSQRDLQGDKNPSAANVPLDFTSVTSLDLDFTQAENNRVVSAILGVFIDNSQNAQSITWTQTSATAQRIIIPANSQAYLPVLSVVPDKMNFATTGAVIVPVQFLNFRPDPIIWSATGLNGTVAAPLFVRDIFRSNLTLSSVTPGADAIVAASNATRSALILQAATTNTASAWINIGAVASASNFIELPPGGSFVMQEPGLVDTRDIHLFGTGGKVTVAVG